MGGGDDTWRAVVESALKDRSKTVAYPDFEALRFQVTDAPPLAAEDRKEAGKRRIDTLPEWFRRPVPAEPPLPRPLAPSGASGMAIEREAETAGPQGAPSLLAVHEGEPPSLAVGRGIAMHRLLQMLPSVDPAERRTRAVDYCRRFERRFADETVSSIVGQALAILDDPRFALLFGDSAGAEVPVMGTLQIGGEKRAVSGVIDRIAVADDRVLLVDYKTNAFAPADAIDVPDVYLRQMALYRALVRPLYPDRPVEAYLLYTAAPRMIALPDSLLDRAYDSFTPS
jgi:ATP-dependent helicase/nuclease subunit A